MSRALFWPAVILILSALIGSADAAPKQRKGVVTRIEPGAIHVRLDENQQDIIVLPSKGKFNIVTITGKVLPEELKPGMLLRFSGTQKAGGLEEEIKEVKVLTPNDGYQATVLKLSDGPPPQVMVTGSFRSLKDGKLSVKAGARPMTVNIANDAKIGWETTDLNVVSPGASVALEGRLTDNKFRANKVLIDLDNLRAQREAEAAAKAAAKAAKENKKGRGGKEPEKSS